jgi:hypothetical protein
LTPIFAPSDVGRFVGVYRTNGSFEDSTLGCLTGQAQANPITCPRSRYLVRRVVAVAPIGVASIAPPLPGSVLASDLVTIFRPDAFVAGELPSRRGGQGGGAGGNAVNSLTFPNPGYANSDRSGAGGGAGGGLLEIYCWGPIDLTNGVLTANGGNGAGGENTIGLDRLGGGSGGGSGGMIRVQSNEVVNLTNASLLARGGSRGPGAFEFVTDPIPPSVPTGMGHGGRGGKGIVQVHAPLGDDGNAKIVFSPGEPLSMKFDPAPVFGTPEFFADPARQRASWFGQ